MSDPRLEDNAHARARRMRNIVTALALGAFVILVFIVSIIRMSGRG